MNSSRIPFPALLLGSAGLLPFFALTAGIVWFPEPNLSYFLGWLVQYGALIAAFTGATQWGIAVRSPEAGPRMQWSAFSWSVCPALLSWIALQMPQYAGVYLLAAVLVLALIMDARLTARLLLPAWYLRLRVLLTCGAVFCLAVAGWVLSTHSTHVH